MAIYSLHHDKVGRTTHPPGAASLHERYITRPDACTIILGRRMPLENTRPWLDAQEQGDRKNARVIDTLIVALPIELSRDQQIELLEAFGERMTQGRASWMAAIHAGQRDADNPHAHMIFRDRDVDTGRRVMMTTEPGSIERFRQGWEEEVNLALERGGREERVDRRSLADQGIAREAQIHVGAGAQALAAKQHEFQSAEKETTRLINGVPSTVTINYPVIDEGKTRFQENEERKARNAEREAAMEGPHRPGQHHSMQAVVDAAARAEALYKRAMRKPNEALDDSDPIALAVVREQLADFYAVQRDRDPDPRWGPFEWGHGPQSRPESTWTPRRGPYPSGPGKPARSETARRYFVEPDNPRGPPGSEPHVSDRKETERAPRRDATALLAGAGLGLFSRIADSLWSFFEGPSGPDTRMEERDMTQENKTRQHVAQQHSAEQQRREMEEAAHWRKVEMQAYLDQRDRERHHDRGR